MEGKGVEIRSKGKLEQKRRDVRNKSKFQNCVHGSKNLVTRHLAVKPHTSYMRFLKCLVLIVALNDDDFWEYFFD